MSGALLGVPSLGYLLALPEMDATIVFTTPRLAAQAVQAAQREIAAPHWSESTRQTLNRLVPKQSTGTEVKVLFSSLLSSPPAVMKELTKAMKERASNKVP